MSGDNVFLGLLMLMMSQGSAPRAEDNSERLACIIVPVDANFDEHLKLICVAETILCDR